ncbi:hypothetical protein Q3G72_008764 [Acer saccharum]|nr:hypothetical protein Q3G72_008764 [Acer saccharum]
MGGGGGELRYEISQNAYIKLVLYARKHKTAAANGVLVGRVSPQKNDVVEITDSVPRLSPVMQHAKAAIVLCHSGLLTGTNLHVFVEQHDVSFVLYKVIKDKISVNVKQPK